MYPMGIIMKIHENPWKISNIFNFSGDMNQGPRNQQIIRSLGNFSLSA